MKDIVSENASQPLVLSSALELSKDQLYAAVTRLTAIAARPVEDGRQHAFPFLKAAPTAIGEIPVHRCLSVPDAKGKLRRMQRLLHRPAGAILDGWNQLPKRQLDALSRLILAVARDEGERMPDEAGRAWYQLDDLLFGLTHAAWINNSRFAVTPPLEFVAQRLGGDLVRLKTQLEQLRWNLAHGSHVEPRVVLWLGDPPSNDRFSWAPRLWVSSRVDVPSNSEAAAKGLYPANTAEQVQNARDILKGRWVERHDVWDDFAVVVPFAPYQTTVCRWCGETNRFRVLRFW